MFRWGGGCLWLVVVAGWGLDERGGRGGFFGLGCWFCFVVKLSPAVLEEMKLAFSLPCPHFWLFIPIPYSIFSLLLLLIYYKFSLLLYCIYRMLSFYAA